MVITEQGKAGARPRRDGWPPLVSAVHPFPFSWVLYTDRPSPSDDLLSEDNLLETLRAGPGPLSFSSILHLTPAILCTRGGCSPKLFSEVAVTAGCWLGFPNGRCWYKFGAWSWHEWNQESYHPLSLLYKVSVRNCFSSVALAPTREAHSIPHCAGWPGPAFCYTTSSLCPSSLGVVATTGTVVSCPVSFFLFHHCMSVSQH